MKKSDRIALITLPIIILIGILVALAGSQCSVMVGGMPLFGLSVGLAFLIQWLVFIPAYLMQTEKFFDITGSITYISLTLAAVFFSAGVDARSILLAGLVVVWAVRLGSILFGRIQKAGKDVWSVMIDSAIGLFGEGPNDPRFEPTSSCARSRWSPSSACSSASPIAT